MQFENPQTMNRYVFVINNPLRYIDPYGLEPSDPWGLLTEEEQNIVSPKLSRQKLGNRLETDQEAFNRLVTVLDKDGKVNNQVTADNLLTVLNFIEDAGGYDNSPVWQQISSIESVGGGVGYGRLTVDIASRKDFLKAAKAEGYIVNNHVMEAIAGIVDYNHRNDSLRAPTLYSSDPQLHFANDGPGLMPSTYFVHWDPTSVNFALRGSPYYGKLIEMGVAATQHTPQGSSPARVREVIDQRRIDFGIHGVVSRRKHLK